MDATIINHLIDLVPIVSLVGAAMVKAGPAIIAAFEALGDHLTAHASVHTQNAMRAFMESLGSVAVVIANSLEQTVVPQLVAGGLWKTKAGYEQVAKAGLDALTAQAKAMWPQESSQLGAQLPVLLSSMLEDAVHKQPATNMAKAPVAPAATPPGAVSAPLDVPASVAAVIAAAGPLAKVGAALVLFLGLTLATGCATLKPLYAPTPAQCPALQKASTAVAGVLGGGAVGTTIGGLATQAGATKTELLDISVACDAVGIVAAGYHWIVDDVLCPAPLVVPAPATSATQPPAAAAAAAAAAAP